MRVFKATNFDPHWVSCGCAIVVARDEAQAQEMLDKQLLARGMKPRSVKFYELHEVKATEPEILHFWSGDY